MTRMIVLVFSRRIHMHFWILIHGSYGHWTSQVTNHLRIISYNIEWHVKLSFVFRCACNHFITISHMHDNSHWQKLQLTADHLTGTTSCHWNFTLHLQIKYVLKLTPASVDFWEFSELKATVFLGKLRHSYFIENHPNLLFSVYTILSDSLYFSWISRSDLIKKMTNVNGRSHLSAGYTQLSLKWLVVFTPCYN